VARLIRAGGKRKYYHPGFGVELAWKDNVYVRGDIHTNAVESAYSLFNRGLPGAFHKVSFKHIFAPAGLIGVKTSKLPLRKDYIFPRNRVPDLNCDLI
jgi:hypothetical protein